MKILVVSPHPDDEILGAGGTILKLKDLGHEVYWLNITDIDEEHGWSSEYVEKRQEQIEKVSIGCNYDGIYNLKLPTMHLETIDKTILIDKIGEVFNLVMPEWIIIPDKNDIHSDHRIVFESCMSCSKIFRYPYIKRITTMEILSETEFGIQEHPFVPNYYIDITDYVDKKIEVMEMYDTELGEPPFPRSIEAIRALALLRGGAAGCYYAEAFHIIKWIE